MSNSITNYCLVRLSSHIIAHWFNVRRHKYLVPCTGAHAKISYRYEKKVSLHMRINRKQWQSGSSVFKATSDWYDEVFGNYFNTWNFLKMWLSDHVYLELLLCEYYLHRRLIIFCEYYFALSIILYFVNTICFVYLI